MYENIIAGDNSSSRTTKGDIVAGDGSSARATKGDIIVGCFSSARTWKGNIAAGNSSSVRTDAGRVAVGSNSVAMGTEVILNGKHSVGLVLDEDGEPIEIIHTCGDDIKVFKILGKNE